jgi:hypothetical protein
MGDAFKYRSKAGGQFFGLTFEDTMNLKISNDKYIEELIDDPHYIIKETGEILTKITRTGKVSVNNVWRNCVNKRKDGYQYISYKYKSLQLHRVVYRKFKGELNDRLVINHIDGNPSNNHIDNLELVTQSKNVEHSYRVLKNPPVIGSSKINKQIADEIRKEYAENKNFLAICKKYSLAKSTISYIINNKIWK